MSLRLKAYQVIMAGQYCPRSHKLWEAVRPWSLEHCGQKLSGECIKSWLEHSCHLLSIRNVTTVLSPQTIDYVLERPENAGMLSCDQPSLFYSSHSEVALGRGASHCGVRWGVSWQCISCAVQWMPAKTQGRPSP